jgi:hypothetical protein
MLKNKPAYIDYLILTLVVIIGYWQVSLNQYTIKCDAALLSLPWKKFVSDSLRSGYFPVWNPYINMGWTQGMEFSTWYYPSWVFALLGKFRLGFLQTEITMHLVLGAIGMYKFLSLFQVKRWAKLHGSWVYILSGFFVGNFQHLGWTYYACWLPLFLFYFIQLVQKPGLPASIRFGCTAAMLILSSYIPFTVTTAIFITLFTGVVVIKKMRVKEYSSISKLAGYLLLSIIVLVVICAPAFYTTFINLDTMYRGGKYTDNTAAFGSLVPMSIINFILPFASTAHSSHWAGTDISMNNVFIGWMSFMWIGMAFFLKEKRRMVITIATLGMIALAFSFGKYFPPTWFIFRHVPFYEKLRFAAQFRLYFIFASAILVALGTQQFLASPSIKKTRLYLIISCLVFAGIAIGRGYLHIFNKFNVVIVQGNNLFSLWQTAQFQSLFWCGLSLILLFFLYAGWVKKETKLPLVIGFNLVVLIMAAQMNMFHTGVANTPVAAIQKKIRTLPERFTPIPNATFTQYIELAPPIGLTWTNTGGLYHYPTINCYHPYDSKNYGEYKKTEPPGGLVLPLVFASAPDANEVPVNQAEYFTSPTDSILLTPYTLEFTTENRYYPRIYVQLSKTQVTTCSYLGTQHPIGIENSLMVIQNIQPNTRIRFNFLPPYLLLLGFVGVCGWALSLIGLFLIKVLKRKSQEEGI